jgi:hypothetical protein
MCGLHLQQPIFGIFKVFRHFLCLVSISNQHWNQCRKCFKTKRDRLCGAGHAQGVVCVQAIKMKVSRMNETCR